MVSLTDIYNIKESTFGELKKDRDPARGNKGKNREMGFNIDPDTGKVTYTNSVLNAFKDLYAEAQDFKELSEENPDDLVIYKMAKDLDRMVLDLRLHIRKKYPEEHKKL